MIYLDDLVVGSETYFGSCEVSREEVIAFAERYDPQPFHLSDEAAAKTHFGRLAASGWQIEHVAPRFLPLSMRSRGSSLSFLVPWYLRSPVKPLAGQMLVVARRPAA